MIRSAKLQEEDEWAGHDQIANAGVEEWPIGHASYWGYDPS